MDKKPVDDNLLIWIKERPKHTEQELIEKSESLIKTMRKKSVYHVLLGIGAFLVLVLIVLIMRFSGASEGVRDKVVNIIMILDFFVVNRMIVIPVVIGHVAIKTLRKGLEEFKAHTFQDDYAQFVEDAEHTVNIQTFPFFRVH